MSANHLYHHHLQVPECKFIEFLSKGWHNIQTITTPCNFWKRLHLVCHRFSCTKTQLCRAEYLSFPPWSNSLSPPYIFWVTPFFWLTLCHTQKVSMIAPTTLQVRQESFQPSVFNLSAPMFFSFLWPLPMSKTWNQDTMTFNLQLIDPVPLHFVKNTNYFN